MGRQWACLAGAWIWGGLVTAVLVTDAIAEPSGIRSITTSGRTYVGDPPALTLAQRDPVTVRIMMVALGLALVVGTGDLVARRVRRDRGTARTAVTLAVLLAMFSLLGLGWGLAGLGGVAVLLGLAALPLRPRSTSPSLPSPLLAPVVNAPWPPPTA